MAAILDRVGYALNYILMTLHSVSVCCDTWMVFFFMSIDAHPETSQSFCFLSERWMKNRDKISGSQKWQLVSANLKMLISNPNVICSDYPIIFPAVGLLWEDETALSKCLFHASRIKIWFKVITSYVLLQYIYCTTVKIKFWRVTSYFTHHKGIDWWSVIVQLMPVEEAMPLLSQVGKK